MSQEATRETSRIFEKINTAHHEWNTYAEILGKAYKEAYGRHEGALSEIAEKYKTEQQVAYWVLSLLCVSFAGGVTGGLMAPVVASAVGGAAVRIANTASGSMSQASQIVTQKVIDGQMSETPLFRPPVKNPGDFKDDLKIEIGNYASYLREEVEKTSGRLSRSENADAATREWADNVIEIVPFLRDHPRYKDRPNPADLEKTAEIGMWIAWANTRNTAYLQKATRRVADGVESYDIVEGSMLTELQRFEPVRERLKALRIVDLTTIVAEFRSLAYTDRYPILDITRLASVGKVIGWGGPGGATFLQNVARAVKEPRVVFEAFSQSPPAFKRAA